MRIIRHSALLLAAFAGACAHDDVISIVSRDSTNVIPVIGLSTSGFAGLLGGTRSVNRYIAAGAFDTAVADAFARSSTNPPAFRLDVNGYYGTTTNLMYLPGAPGVATFAPPSPYKPALVGAAYASNGGFATNAVAYIVQPTHPGNGGTVWEFWYEIDGLSANTRYVMGVARYALQVNGALDGPERMLTGAVSQPDSLVFRAGDFAPAGRKNATVYTTNCASLNIVQPVAGANPHYLGTALSDGTGYAGFDQTACANAASAWGNLNTAKSVVPTNNTAAGLVSPRYNFVVIWEALADSTPDYSKPVFRYQMGPLMTTGGVVINNSFAPFPTAQLTSLQLGPLPGSTSRPDTMKLTFNNLKPLVSGAYQVWLLRTDSAKTQLVTGRVVRLNGATVVDTLNAATEFNTGGVITGARVEFDVANFPAGFWNAATLAVAGSTGNTTLPTAQPVWTASVAKASGQVASLGGNLSFGSFKSGASPVLFGPAGTGVGGVFGLELREDVKRLPRPPIGYMYEAWLINTGDSTKFANLGTLLAPYPELTSLVDADVSTAPPVSGVELTQAAIRYVAASRAYYCNYNRIQVRLAPKNGNTGIRSPSIILTSANVTFPGC